MRRLVKNPHRKVRMDPMGYPVNKFQVFLFALCVINGISLMLSVPVSASLDGTLSEWQVRCYGLMLALGGGCVILGLYWWRDPRTALLIKRYGYIALAFATLIYGVAVFVFQRNPGGLFSASITVAFAALCIDQVAAINGRVNELIAAEMKLNDDR